MTARLMGARQNYFPWSDNGVRRGARRTSGTNATGWKEERPLLEASQLVIGWIARDRPIYIHAQSSRACSFKGRSTRTRLPIFRRSSLLMWGPCSELLPLRESRGVSHPRDIEIIYFLQRDIFTNFYIYFIYIYMFKYICIFKYKYNIKYIYLIIYIYIYIYIRYKINLQ